MLTAFSVVSSMMEVGEADGAAYVAVYVDDHGSNTVTVDYATSPGTTNPAAANSDYATVSGRLTFAPSEFSKVVSVTIINDLYVEADETFTLALSTPSSGCTLNPDLQQTTVTILDNDVPGNQAEINVLDGQMIVGDELGSVDFGATTVGNPLRRTFTVENQGSATLTLANPTLPTGFSLYTPLGTTSLAAGATTSFTVQLDAAAAGTYSGELSLGNNDNPNDGDTEDPNYNFNIHGIVNGPGSVTLSVNDVNVQEGGTAAFTVSLSRALVSGKQVTVAYATADGTAENVFDCSDYTATSGSLTFLPGQALSKTVNVVTRQDPVPEDDEDFFLNLSNLTGAAFYDSQGRGVILNNDGPANNGTQLLVTAPDAGNTITLHLYDANEHDDGPVVQLDAYDSTFHGGVRVATGDINGDGYPDVITGAGSTGGPHVRTFDGRSGVPLARDFFAYASNFTGGIYVAAGDVNGDGIDDIITGAGAGGGPDVKIFDGATGTPLKEWFAFASNFTGGVQVAAGDVNGDGLAEVITGAGPGGGPDVRIWSVSGASVSMLYDFFPYASNFSGGVYVAAGDLNGDGLADIVTGDGAGGGPHVKAFSGASYSTKLADYFAYPSTVTMGVRVTVGDTLGKGTNQIITAPGPGGGSHVRMFDEPYSLLCGFFAYPTAMLQGVFVAGSKTQTKVGSVEFIPASQVNFAGLSQAQVDQYGTLELSQNPDGDGTSFPAFQGGHRFFPDAKSITATGTASNVVRVRATITPAKAGVTVYFRSYDVDDPSSSTDIDGNGSAGNDNVGTFAANGTNFNFPGASTASGNAGAMRGISLFGTLQPWNQGVVSTVTNAQGIAEADLATTFAPGDNFRVVATTVSTELNQLIANPSNIPTKGNVTLASGAATPQLSVWRHLHVERDWMADSAVLGDRFSVTASGASQLIAAPDQWRVSVAIVPGTAPPGDDGIVRAHEFEGGLLRVNGVNYDIIDNTANDSGFDVTFFSNQAPNIVSGAQITLYEDDFRRDFNVPNAEPVRNVNPETVQTAMFQFMQPGTARATNRFADAYIEPTYSVVAQFGDALPSRNHFLQTWVEDADVKLDTGTSHRGTAALETDVFWVVYVSSAYQMEKPRDRDPDRWFLTGQQPSLEEADSPGGNTSRNNNQASFVLVETIYDGWVGAQQFGQTQAASYFEQLGRTTVHEVGHQFNIAYDPQDVNIIDEHRPGDNIMNASTSQVPLTGFYFHAKDVRKLRDREFSPGGTI